MLVVVGLCLSFSTMAQDRSLSGKVTDGSGTPLPGVSVLVKGSNRGTTTDGDGTYKLSVGEGAKVVVSYVGFASQELAVGNQSVLNVSLTEDSRQLDEVVVSGLATSVKRSNLANAISTISGKELMGSTRPQTLDGALNGKLTGANISANSGAPGGGFSVRLRGISSINLSSEPLYIVDGVYVNNSQFQTGAGTGSFNGATGQTSGTQDQAANRMADINPADIESVEVLKGPSAAAIYGTRANAGVIIITTKKGKSGKTSIQFGQDFGVAKALRLIGMQKTPWDADKINKGIFLVSNEEMADLFKANGSGAKTADYEKEIYGNTGMLSTSRLSLSGGNDKIRFFTAGTLLNEGGIQKNTGFKRGSLRLNLDYKVNNFIDLSIGSNYLNSSSSRGFSGNDNNGVSIGYNLAYLPNWLEQHPDAKGVYPQNPLTGQNILQIIDKAENNEKTNRFIQSFAANIRFINNEKHTLKLALQGGLDYLLSESEVYMPDDIQFQTRRANAGASRYTKSRNLNSNLQAFLVDELTVNKFNFNTSVGTVRLETNQEVSYIQGDGLPSGQRNPNLATVRLPFISFAKWQDVGFVAQEQINWDDKVIATAGIRFDKSSLNGDNKKFFAFPKASLAVNVAKFDFWKVDQISMLKFRAAYGETGNPAGFGNLFTSTASVIIDAQPGLISPTSYGNRGIEPERATEIEGGVDVGLFGNRLNIEATIYNKKILNYIDAFALSPGTGVTQVAAFPVGDLQNTGLELSFSGTPVKKSNVTWNTTVSFWNNQTKITRLIVPEYQVGASGFGAFGTNRVRLGESPNAWFGTPLLPDGSRTRYETSQPKFQLSWSNNITFLKNFEFAFLLHTSQGNYNASLNQELTDEGGTSPDWNTPSATDKNVPVGVARQLGQPGITTRQFIVDASYIKLREVSLYYNVPKSILPKAVEGVRVGFSGNNVFLSSPYFGYDPEASNFGNRPVGGGVDLLSFPSSRRLFFHLNVSF